MRKTRTTMGILFFLLIPIIYIAIQLFSFESDGVYETDTIVNVTVSDSIEVQGIIGRDELVITYGAGILGFTVDTADRVSQNAVVAASFASQESAQQSAYADMLSAQLEVLVKSGVSTSGTDTAMLQMQVQSNAKELLNAIQSGDFENYYDYKQNLQLSVNKLNLGLGQEIDYTQSIAQTQEAMQNAQSMAVATNINAPAAGYFVPQSESSQSVYTVQQLNEMSAQQLQEAALVMAPEHSADVVGKLALSHIWSFYTSVPIQQANKFKAGQSVNIYFDESAMGYEADIISVEEDEAAGLAKIVLQSNLINADVLSKEHTSAQIEFRQIEGYRISKDALRVKDAIDGVYVLRVNIIEFCEIEILYEQENYYIVSPTYEVGENEVRLYDEAIVGGADLYDGKLL